jgi:putative salt-induced outer membrane protein
LFGAQPSFISAFFQENLSILGYLRKWPGSARLKPSTDPASAFLPSARSLFMCKSITALAIVALSLAAFSPSAAEAASTWTGGAELGMVITGGNTDTRNINAKANVENDRDKWRHSGSIEAVNTSDEGGTTSERYLAQVKADRKLGEYNYLFGLAVFDTDRFAGYSSRTSETLGLGRRMLSQDDLTLDLEAGVGARQTEATPSGDRTDEMLLRGAGNLGWQISKSASLSEALTVDIGEESTITRSVTGLKNQLNGSLSSKITFTFKNTTDTPSTVKANDYETAITLVWGF